MKLGEALIIEILVIIQFENCYFPNAEDQNIQKINSASCFV